MVETTLNRQDPETINRFLQDRNIPANNWTTHGRWRVIRVGELSIISTLGTRKLTFQGESNARLPLVGEFLIYKRDQECRVRNVTEAEIESARQQIMENERKSWHYECEDWGRSEEEGAINSHLKRRGGWD